MRTTLTNGTHVEITREAGKGADVLAIRSLTRNPITGEVTTAALVAAPYVQHVTASLLSVLGVRDDDMPAVLALASPDLLDFDTAEALGFDATGRDGDTRYPYTQRDLDAVVDETSRRLTED